MEEILNNISYKTKQKELILTFLKNNKESHLTVDEILFNLQKEGTPVGKTTVYRALEKLEAQNLIRKYSISGTSSCFQYIGDKKSCHSHYHLKCSHCNKLFHIKDNNLDKAVSSIMKTNHFAIDNSKTVLYGICKECNNKI